MQISDLPDEDKTALRESLLQWKTDGVENPTIPLDVDLDGDGITDAYGLDDKGELVLIPGVKLEDTVYETGGDEEPAEVTE